MTRDNSFDFWSRRRAAVAAETEAEAQAREAAERRARDQQLEERPDEDILAELNLPAPEEMTDTDQVQALLRAPVPQRLRTRALRRLWRLNPVFSHRDGLLEYGGDYTDAATVTPDMKTIYKVGKGMFDKVVEAAEEADRETARAAARTDAEAEAQAEAPDQVRGAAAPAETAGTATPAVEERPVPASAPGPAAAHADAPEETAPRPSRRMRFRFDAAS